MTETDVLTRLLINPGHVFLVTGKRRKRWLTDRYVMFDVTAATDVQDLADGEYKLTKRGFTRIEDDALASIGRGKLPQVDKLVIDRCRDAVWLPLHDTPWLRPLDLNGRRFAYLASLFYTGENGDRQAVLLSAAVLDAAREFYDPQRITVETALMKPASEEATPARIARVRSGRAAAVGYLIPPRVDGDDEDTLRLIGEEIHQLGEEIHQLGDNT